MENDPEVLTAISVSLNYLFSVPWVSVRGINHSMVHVLKILRLV